MNLHSFLGTNVTTNTGKMVLVEDTYPKQRVCGKTPTGEFIVLSPVFNTDKMAYEFTEVDMTDEKAKWAFKPVPPTPAYAAIEPKAVVQTPVTNTPPEPVTLEKFITMLQTHDWYYNYTDDGKVWRDGKNVEDEIHRIIRERGTKYEQAYNQYKPVDFAAWK